MPIFEVVLTRTTTRVYRLRVQAPTAQIAREQAQARQGDINFFEGTESTPEYGVEEVLELVDGKPITPPPDTPPDALPHQGEFEISRTLVLSTGHITRHDSDLLDRSESPVVAFEKAENHNPACSEACGWWVHVPDSEDGVSSEAQVLAAGYSPEFVKLLALARQFKCDWLMLDRDGPQHHGLPFFHW
jgi:hypothetical protein